MPIQSSRLWGARHLAFLLPLYALSLPAHAHVKWFAKFDIICPPRDPQQVVSSHLWQAFLVAAIATTAVLAWVDHHLDRSTSLHALTQRADQAVLPRAIALLRWGLCAYWLMVVFGLRQTVYLTPELSAPGWIVWVQLACAVLVLFRRTAWLAGIALLSLYAMAIADHGWFHLLDYPLFAALGVILILTRWRVDHRTLLDLLRWSAAITLIWGGIEKFAYPQWSLPMMLESPFLSLGVAPETAMFIYGFTEIALSFGLLFFRAGSQVAAALLLLVFVAAVLPFGWVDLVGHSGIVVALALLVVTRPGRPLVLRGSLQHAGAHGILFAATLALFGGAYARLHALYLDQAASANLARARLAAPMASGRLQQPRSQRDPG
jgi:hypothetical protein